MHLSYEFSKEKFEVRVTAVCDCGDAREVTIDLTRDGEIMPESEALAEIKTLKGVIEVLESLLVDVAYMEEGEFDENF